MGDDGRRLSRGRFHSVEGDVVDGDGPVIVHAPHKVIIVRIARRKLVFHRVDLAYLVAALPFENAFIVLEGTVFAGKAVELSIFLRFHVLDD